MLAGMAALLLCCGVAMGQGAPYVNWLKVIGSEESEIYGALSLKQDGGVLVGGYIESGATNFMGSRVPTPCHFAYNLDSNGQLLWSYLTPPGSFHAPNNQLSISETSNGDVLLLAQRLQNCAIHRLGADGRLIETFPISSKFEQGSGLPVKLVAWPGGYYACFSSRNALSPDGGPFVESGANLADVYVLAFDNEHRHLWTLSGGTVEADSFADAAAGADGRLVLASSSPQNLPFTMGGKTKPGNPTSGRGSTLALINPDGGVAWLGNAMAVDSNPMTFNALALDQDLIRVVGAGSSTQAGLGARLWNIDRYFMADIQLESGELIDWRPLTDQTIPGDSSWSWFTARSVIPLGSKGFMIAGTLRARSTTSPIFYPTGTSDGMIMGFGADSSFAWGLQFVAGLSNYEWIWDLKRGPSGTYFGLATVQAPTVRLGVQVARGLGGNDLVVFKLSDNPPPPVILQHPVGSVAYLGGSVSFEVKALESAAQYQWFQDGKPIAGANGPSLSFPAVGPGRQGDYTVEVSNQHGSTRSAAATLRLLGQLPLAVTTLAGDGTPGLRDGIRGSEARFNRPNGPVVRPNGTIFVADTQNHVVRAISNSGAVGIYAGAAGGGYLEGPGSSALFNSPIALLFSPEGDLLVADAANNRVRAIDMSDLRLVTTLAGSGGGGLANGPALEAQFNFPNDLVATSSGELLISEFNNHAIRAVSRQGVVRTLAGSGMGYRNGAGGQAQFNQPAGIALDAQGNAYVTEWGNHTIRKIAPNGLVTLVAGTPGVSGFKDGPALQALLKAPDAIVLDAVGNIFFTEAGNHAVRVVRPDGELVTLAGDGQPGFADGDGTTAKLNQPGGLAIHPDGSLIIADTGNHRVRRLRFEEDVPYPTPAVAIAIHPAVTIYGEAGKIYRIEASESSGPTARWIQVGTVRAASPVEMWHDTQPVTRSRRHYRVLSNE